MNKHLDDKMVSLQENGSPVEEIEGYLSEINNAHIGLTHSLEISRLALKANDIAEAADISLALDKIETFQDELIILRRTLVKLKTRPTITVGLL